MRGCLADGGAMGQKQAGRIAKSPPLRTEEAGHAYQKISSKWDSKGTISLWRVWGRAPLSTRRRHLKLAAAAVVAAVVVVAAAAAVVAEEEEEQNQNDNPPEAVAIVTAHKKHSLQNTQCSRCTASGSRCVFFGSGLFRFLVSSYAGAGNV